MDGRSQHAEIPTLSVAQPGLWASLEGVTLRADGRLLYVEGPPVPTRPEGKWRTDERSRTALEAFTALRLGDVAQGLDARRAPLISRGLPITDTWDVSGGADLRTFLQTFGPVHVGLGSRFSVRNPVAERSEARAQAAETELSFWRQGLHPEPVRSTWRNREWLVTFEGWAQGYHGTAPDVTRTSDDAGPSEALHSLRYLQERLTTATGLAHALAESAHWSSDHTPRDRIRAVFLAEGGSDLNLVGGATNWRRVMPGVPADVYRVVLSEDGAIPAPRRLAHEPDQPSSGGPWPVDWLMAGRMLLADMIGRHVQWAQLYMAVDDAGHLQTEWLTKSLEEVMYLQLMEHVQRRPRKRLISLPYWPMPRCGYCAGVILDRSPRGPDGRFGNRWHPGRCRSAGQMAEIRRGTLPI